MKSIKTKIIVTVILCSLVSTFICGAISIVNSVSTSYEDSQQEMQVLQDIQQRDDNLYRVIFMADPIPSAIRQAGYGGTNRYEINTKPTSTCR